MTATKAAEDKWLSGAVGRQMNPDHAYGLQCVDVADDYVDALYGIGSWPKVIKAGDAKDLFSKADPKYFNKVKNNPQDSSQIPPRGSIISWGGTRAVPEGHIAVVVTADTHYVTVIQQDGYLQYPARQVRLPYVLPNGANVIGWLIPKLQATPKKANQKQIKQAYLDILEREADKGGLSHYSQYPLAFVRADLLHSAERKKLEARKAAAAKAAADQVKRAAAIAAEKQRIAEQQAAAQQAQAEANRLAEDARQSAALVAQAEAEAARRAAEDKARAEREVVLQPVVVPTQNPAPDTAPSTPPQPNPIVNFLYNFYTKYVKKT